MEIRLICKKKVCLTQIEFQSYENQRYTAHIYTQCIYGVVWYEYNTIINFSSWSKRDFNLWIELINIAMDSDKNNATGNSAKSCSVVILLLISCFQNIPLLSFFGTRELYKWNFYAHYFTTLAEFVCK